VSAMAIGGIVFACVFGGALCGTLLRAVLPAHHLSPESTDVVKLGMGLIATMAALVLGLLIASAQGAYNTLSGDLTQLSANISLLDRVMAHYGPETTEARELLRRAVVRALAQMWPAHRSGPAQVEPTAGSEALYDTLLALAPQDDAQRALKAQALQLGTDIGQTRWLRVAQRGNAISMPFLVLLVFWVTVLFVSFGLFAPPNATVIATLCICALSVAGAMFLILELSQPFEGLIQISSAPLRNALTHLGQ
jgi:Protein of unknown function (DUF4239)